MRKNKKEPSEFPNDRAWLDTEPLKSEIEISPYGGYHIPIEKLRPLLDRLFPSVTDYHVAFYKDEHNRTCVSASLELTVGVDGMKRICVGAYNMVLKDAPNPFWNATLKSECLKNAAAELGKRLGRGLNINSTKEDIQMTKVNAPKPVKPKPDSKIMQQFLKAVEKGDKATITTLSNIYEIKTNE